MSKVIDEVRHKIACGQNLFRRSTIEKMLAEYDRLLMRNTALENAVEHVNAADGGDAPVSNEQCGNCDAWRTVRNGVIEKCRNCGDEEIELVAVADVIL